MITIPQTPAASLTPGRGRATRDHCSPRSSGPESPDRHLNRPRVIGRMNSAERGPAVPTVVHGPRQSRCHSATPRSHRTPAGHEREWR